MIIIFMNDEQRWVIKYKMIWYDYIEWVIFCIYID
jgi:hypothetical protein